MKFAPLAEGLRTARVHIYNNDSNEGDYWFNVQGYGIIPKPDINLKGNTGGTSNITSGNMIPVAGNNTLWAVDQLVGSTVVKDYRIQNVAAISSVLQLTGTPKVIISGANPSDFVVTAQPSATNINGGFGSNFTIAFTPTAAGIRTALVTIPNNDLVADPFTLLPESPYTFLIQGRGIAPEIDITGNTQPIASGSTTPTLVNHTFFDYLNITGATLDRTYTIKNLGAGAAPLTIGALSITGPNASDFSIISTPAATLAVGATTTFSIRFDPSTVGEKNAVIRIVNSDYDENPYTFAVRGFGLDYIPCAYGAVETIAI
ncbi:MAG: choice-of-anchor D domain-containing protein, partial [Cytophagaceae bacterium]